MGAARKNLGSLIFLGMIITAFSGLFISGYVTFFWPTKDLSQAAVKEVRKGVTVQQIAEHPENFHEGELVEISGSAHAIDIKQELAFDDMKAGDARQYIAHELKGYTNLKITILLASRKNLTGSGSVFHVLQCEIRRSSGGLYLLEKKVVRSCILQQYQWIDRR